MKASIAAVVMAAFAATLSSQAHAATLYTQGASSIAAETLYCQAVNVKSAPVDVTIEVHHIDGTVLSSSNGPITIQPGHIAGRSSSQSGADYCKFIVAGSKRAVRAAAFFSNPANNDEYTVAVPAQ